VRVLDLFSGIGGFSLGLESVGMQTVGFCEQDKFCQKVLKKHWPDVPIHEDITKLDGRAYRDTTQLICGGFPCQPFSVAGKQRGSEDDRALWPQMLRVIREVQPTWVVGENVTGIINMELDNVLSDLEAEGYSCQTFVIPACAVDAQHRRDRVWVVAHADSDSEPDGSINDKQRARELVAHTSGEPRWSGRVHRESGYEGWGTSEARGEGVQPKDGEAQSDNPTESGQDVADTQTEGLQRYWESRELGKKGLRRQDAQNGGSRGRAYCWEPEPGVGRVAHGVPDRTHRLKSLGNAVVPQVVAEIGRIIMAIHNHEK